MEFVRATLEVLANNGVPDAWYQLGLLFSTGKHTKKNLEYANYLFSSSYEVGYKLSGGMWALNLIDEFTKRNYPDKQLLTQAIAILEDIYTLNEISFNRELYRAYFLNGDISLGEKMLEECANSGDLKSKFDLANYLSIRADLNDGDVSRAKKIYLELIDKEFMVEQVKQKLDVIKQ